MIALCCPDLRTLHELLHSNVEAHPAGNPNHHLPWETRLPGRGCTAQIYPLQFFFFIVLNWLGFPISIYLFQQHKKQTVKKKKKKNTPKGLKAIFILTFFFWMILIEMAAHNWFVLFTIKGRRGNRTTESQAWQESWRAQVCSHG